MEAFFVELRCAERDRTGLFLAIAPGVAKMACFDECRPLQYSSAFSFGYFSFSFGLGLIGRCLSTWFFLPGDPSTFEWSTILRLDPARYINFSLCWGKGEKIKKWKHQKLDSMGSRKGSPMIDLFPLCSGGVLVSALVCMGGPCGTLRR